MVITWSILLVTSCIARADSYKEFNDKLERMYGETNKRDRALQMLLTLRNFSSHNISAG